MNTRSANERSDQKLFEFVTNIGDRVFRYSSPTIPATLPSGTYLTHVPCSVSYELSEKVDVEKRTARTAKGARA
jgi:hypothetical protein